MSDLAAQLDLMFRRYAAECDKDNDEQPWKWFRDELRWLIAKHGPKAVDAALDEIPDRAGSPVVWH